MVVTSTTLRIAEEELSRLASDCSQAGAIDVSREEVDAARQGVQKAKSEVDHISGTQAEAIYRGLESFVWQTRLLFGNASAISGLPEYLIAFFLSIAAFGLALFVAAMGNAPAYVLVTMSIVVLVGSFVPQLLFLSMLPVLEATAMLERRRHENAARAAALEEPTNRLQNAIANHANLCRRWELRERLETARQELVRLREQFNERKERLLRIDWRSLRGTSFEQFLVEVFESLGFSVQTTKASGDQGVDLLATRDAFRIAIQAKGYLGSVGNGAVQEAFAGMAFYNCNRCTVITNSEFTNSARELAAKTGCVLIDGSLLPRLIAGQVF